jgi:hypothetical protein
MTKRTEERMKKAPVITFGPMKYTYHLLRYSYTNFLNILLTKLNPEGLDGNKSMQFKGITSGSPTHIQLCEDFMVTAAEIIHEICFNNIGVIVNNNSEEEMLLLPTVEGKLTNHRSRYNDFFDYYCCCCCCCNTQRQQYFCLRGI